MRITVAFLFAVLAAASTQEFGARLNKLSRTGRIGQTNGYFYPEPSPSFTLPAEKPTTTTTTTTRRPTTAPVVVEVSTQPPVDYLPPTTTTTTTTRRPTTTARSYVQCSFGETCVLSSAACSNQNGQATGSGECRTSGGQGGVCCRPNPTTTRPTTTTTRPTTTTTRATTTTTRTTTTQRPVTTTPSLEYLPPTTTKGYNYEVPENPLFPDNTNQNQQILRPTTTKPPVAPVVQEDDEIAFWDFRESIPGEPEIDYPIFDKIPETAFSCAGKIDGFYADIETRCQVFHVCVNVPEADPIKNSFLCPNGTLFHQESFACQWWPDVECASSANFFNLNENIGKVPEPAAASSNVRISAGQAGISASASASSSSIIGAPSGVKSSAAASSNSGRKY